MIRTIQLLQAQALRLVDPALQAVSQWPVASQQRARRNAMIASTDLAQRRAVREDVEEFLVARHPRRAVDPQTDQARQG